MQWYAGSPHRSMTGCWSLYSFPFPPIWRPLRSPRKVLLISMVCSFVLKEAKSYSCNVVEPLCWWQPAVRLTAGMWHGQRWRQSVEIYSLHKASSRRFASASWRSLDASGCALMCFWGPLLYIFYSKDVSVICRILYLIFCFKFNTLFEDYYILAQYPCVATGKFYLKTTYK
jgi:hypothetical protein